MGDPDHCPQCGRQIDDYDYDGCELATGQRWCSDHLAWVAIQAVDVMVGKREELAPLADAMSATTDATLAWVLAMFERPA